MACQLDFLDVLFAKEPTAKKALCETWQCAVKNECGVFCKNVHSFPMGSFKDYFLELSLALNFPYVFGSVRIQLGSPNFYGSCSPIVGDDDLIQFNVFDNYYDVECELTTRMNSEIVDNPNLKEHDVEHLLKLVSQVVEKAMTCMKEEN